MIASAQKQFPGLYKRRIGDAIVTAVNDGYIDMPFEILRGASLDDMRALMREAFHEGPPRITVNAFVIQTSRRTILVDAGGGAATSMGLLLENLAAGGFRPTDFDTILITHIHPDHTNGLLNQTGGALFPNAQIVIPEADYEFWSDPRLRDGHLKAAAPFIDSANAVLDAYRDQLRLVRQGSVEPAISLLPLPGHTPGHSGYRLDSAGDTLVIWGDTVHVPEIQIRRLGVTSEYDIDEHLAAESRQRIFEVVASERLLVAGAHLHVPAFAHVIRSKDSFQLAPEHWSIVV